ncbi:MAG TPA: protein kinase [Actinomycetales bacterium]|nr:protein kinase [Actinomycetales bacterium]
MTTSEAGQETARLGPYRLLGRLGEGGMGVVHLGLDPAGRAVAVKVLREHVAHDPDARARLAREVSTLQRVRHPLVAEVIDADVDGPQPFVVTRFVNGPPLDEVVREHGPMTPEALVALGRGLSEALQAIHAAGVVHRDLKPGNVLLLDGRPVVIDFGIAHVADDVRLTTVGLVMGTPGYLSPEVVDGDAVTTATDWWGWAATLAFAASGRPPFGRGPMDVVIDRVRRGDTDLDAVDARLRPLLAAALSVDPDDRPHADEVLAGVERYAAGGDTTTVLRHGGAPTLPVRSDPTWVAPVAGRLAGTTGVDERPAAASSRVPALAAAGSPVEGSPVERAPVERPPGQGVPPAAVPTSEQPGRSPRTGTLLAAVATVVAGAAAWPVVTAAVVIALMVLARTVDRGTSALARRRYEHGARRTDGLVAVVSSPWHLLAGVLATLVTVLLPAALGLATVFLTGLLLSPDGRPSPGSQPAVAAGALVALLAAWWGAGGRPLRRGSRALVRGLVPGRSARLVVPLLLLTAVAAAYLAYRSGAPDWTPLRTLPFGITPPR